LLKMQNGELTEKELQDLMKQSQQEMTSLLESNPELRESISTEGHELIQNLLEEARLVAGDEDSGDEKDEL